MTIVHSFILVVGLLCVVVRSTHVTQQPLVNWEFLKSYVVYSYAAFCVTGLQNWTCYWCEPFLNVLPVTVTQIISDNGIRDVYGYVGHSSSAIIVSFRGSVSVSNWIKDAEFYQSPYPTVADAYVHHGFLTSYQSVQPTVKQAVANLRILYPNLPIITTGHSLGAALSVLCATDLSDSGFSNISVINFGQPRVGNSVFVTHFMKGVSMYYRVVNQNDLVPHLPPKTLGYLHGPTELWFKSGYYDFMTCDDSGEDPHCSDSIFIDFDMKKHIIYLGFFQHDAIPFGCPGSLIW